MPPAEDPGVTAPPAEDPAAPAAPAPSEPTGSEPVINPSGTEEQTVPYTRFQEVNKAKADAEEKSARLESELEAERQAKAPVTSEEDDDIDPETLDLVNKSAKKLGFVSKEELDARDLKDQVQKDIDNLTSEYKDSSVPFDGKAVIKYANDNNMPLGSKQSLDAVYQYMNRDAIIEANRKAAIESFQKGSASSGEKPGSAGAKLPEEPKPGNLHDRITTARKNAGVTIT